MSRKTPNGSMISRFGGTVTRPTNQTILPLDLSPQCSSTKLGFAVPTLRNGSKTPGARSLGGQWHSSQACADFDLGGLREHVERCDRLDDELILQLCQIAR